MATTVLDLTGATPAINADRVNEGTSIRVNNGQLEVQETYHVAWADVPRLIAYVFQGTAGDPAPLVAASYDTVYCYARDLDVQPMGLSDDGSTSECANVRITFRSPEGNGNSFYQVTTQAGAQAVTAPYATYNFQDGSGPVAQNVGVIIPTQQVTAKVSGLSALNTSYLRSLTMKVNSVAIGAGAGDLTGAAPGTVLFTGFSAAEKFHWNAGFEVECTLSFVWRAVDHNSVLHPDPSKGFQPVERAPGSGIGIYESAPLDPLFVRSNIGTPIFS